MSAQEKMVSVFPAERQLPEGLLEGKGARMQDENTIQVREAADFVAEVSVDKDVRVVRTLPNQKKKVAQADPTQQCTGCTEDCNCDCGCDCGGGGEKAGYLNPEGTLFLGYTPDGGNTFIQNPGVIGAWASDLKCWKWRNTTTGSYSTIDYENGFISRYPTLIEDGEFYGVDKDYNFTDSIMAQGGYMGLKDVAGDEGYIWQYGLPLQIVHRESGDEKYVMLTKYSDQSKLSNEDCKITAGGLPTARTSDGLWPLTNAVSTNKDGQSTSLYYTVGSTKLYYFGTSKVDGLMPSKITTHYDKPQRKLYVKSISVFLGSNGTMKYATPHIDVINANGEIIAQSDAALSSATTVRSPSGKMLTFYFQQKSAYGEMLKEGFAIDEAFDVVLSGIKEGDNFGIYSAKSSVYASKSKTILSDESKVSVNYDPYIMLNGIYPTLEDYLVAENPEIDLNMSGDTLPIKFNLTEGLTYQYGATYAVNKNYNGISEFAFYSTALPYDASTRYWTFDIERPAYITMSADYETHMGNDPEQPTLWEYYRLFTLYIYATEKPVVGDCIKIGKYGKNIVFRIDEVMDSQSGLTRKKLVNGHIEIERGGKRYNVQGLLIK